MRNVTRRGLLGGALVAGGAAVVGAPMGTAAAEAPADVAAGTRATGACDPPATAITVPRQDPRYPGLVQGYNGRFVGKPDSVRLVYSADQVVRVVDEAVRAGKRIAVRSGGHCFEDFVDNADVRIVIDVSELNSVCFDPTYQAFSVGAGAKLGHVYRTLYLRWGVTIPGGGCPSVGVGGHIAGGGYGALSRMHGLVVDHLYGVEVVVVDRSGRARLVVATREPSDPNRDLWWAHTGGGGGNFGVVTRYLLRSPQASGSDPTRLLPRPPANYMSTVLTWQWADMTEPAFRTLLRNYGRWHERDNASGSPQTGLGTALALGHRATGQFILYADVDAAAPDGERLADSYLAAVTKDVGVEPARERFTQSWMLSTLNVTQYAAGNPFKTKAAFLRKSWSDEQIATVHRYLNDGDQRWGVSVYLSAVGGRINSVAPDATAFPHRNSIFSVTYDSSWAGQDEAEELAWIRRFYQEVYASTGGVPVPGAAYDGAYISYPDTDLADPQWNRSGVPWHTIYYQGNYRRLQQVKARWDPRNVFRHALSVRP